MKVAKYTHKAFDGVGIVKGWVIEDLDGKKHWVYFTNNGICVHEAEYWEGELHEIK